MTATVIDLKTRARRAPTIDDMARDPNHWPELLEIVRADSLPPGQDVRLFGSYPQWASWVAHVSLIESAVHSSFQHAVANAEAKGIPLKTIRRWLQELIEWVDMKISHKDKTP